MGAALAKDADHPATGAAAKELLCSSAEITTGDENAQAIVHVLTCGSVDDGKSTLIGRLLWDVADLPEDTRASVAETLLPDGRIDLSRLVDGLAAERAQGITIDIAWRYVLREKLDVVPLYLAAIRPTIERNGTLLVLDDDRMRLAEGEKVVPRRVRFRTLGCWPLTAAIESEAADLLSVVTETLAARTSERQGRLIDHDQAGAMEKKKQEGYF